MQCFLSLFLAKGLVGRHITSEFLSYNKRGNLFQNAALTGYAGLEFLFLKSAIGSFFFLLLSETSGRRLYTQELSWFFHLIRRPTLHGASRHISYSERYLPAEEYGKSGGDCKARFPLCPTSPFGIFSLPSDPNHDLEWTRKLESVAPSIFQFPIVFSTLRYPILIKLQFSEYTYSTHSLGSKLLFQLQWMKLTRFFWKLCEMETTRVLICS